MSFKSHKFDKSVWPQWCGFKQCESEHEESLTQFGGLIQFAALQRVLFHTSLLIEAGAAIKEIQQRLGHTDLNKTMNIYGHMTANKKEKASHQFTEPRKTLFKSLFIFSCYEHYDLLPLKSLYIRDFGLLHHAAHMVLSCNIFNVGRRKSCRISILQASSVISLTLIYFVLLDFVSMLLAVNDLHLT